ncbi:MAG TPA: RAMP superfamily CRISPR-associated protein [Limnochordia bacterium]|jgi:CRISPR/Cas system CSM-associated protein Csm3 (group 7 of RAMP superfamily)|nr:RAMP superfamily CRISPR-associated protein [Limnochordia bacterium]HPZ31812.1 RAMP superfamily CRISPR-associated protein [Limnochordia bacterium]
MHRSDVQFRLEFSGRWHIGSGTGRGLIDNAVRLKRIWRDGKFILLPALPGSTIKGVLRQECERIAELFGQKWIDPHDEAAVLQQGFCPLVDSDYIVDRLFGTRYQGECLFVEDGQWIGEANVLEGISHRVAIDRSTGTVMPEHLFVHNYIDQGAFRCQITAIHQDDDLHPLEGSPVPMEYVLLIAGILGLGRLGSNRSVGLGETAVLIESVVYNDRQLDYLDVLPPVGGIPE